MAEAALKEKTAAEEERELTDGFHLIIDALKLKGLTTIYGVPGIPITDFGRMAQASGIRVLSFRHEQNAGYAASIAGFLTKKPGVCLTVSAPGFLNGLTALPRAIRAAVSGRPGGVYLDLPAKLFGQVMDAEAGQMSLVKVIDPAPAQIPAPDAAKRALDVLKSAKRPLIILGKGAAYAQADDAI